MARKKTVKNKEVEYDYVKENELYDSELRTVRRLCEINERIDRIVSAHESCKSLRGL